MTPRTWTYNAQRNVSVFVELTRPHEAFLAELLLLLCLRAIRQGLVMHFGGFRLV